MFLRNLVYCAHGWFNRSAFYLLMRLHGKPCKNTATRPCSLTSCLITCWNFAHLIILIIISNCILSINFRDLNWWCGWIILVLNLSIHRVTGSWLRLSCLFLRSSIICHVTSLFSVQELIVLLGAILVDGRSIHVDGIKSFNWII